MSKKDFKDFVCRPFCKFFREGEKEDMACQGAQVIERLLAQGRLTTGELPRRGKHAGLWHNPSPDLVERVCGRCAFQACDCDYQAARPPRNAEPCGGFILLALLNESRLTPRDLEPDSET